MKSRVVLLPSLLLVMLIPLMALGSSGCGKDNDTSGNKVWMRHFGSSEFEDAFAAVADGVGNIYVAGITGGTFAGQISSGNYDVFIAKYDISGKEVWTKQFGSSGYDYARAVVADGSGNIYVAGYTGGTLLGQTSSGHDDAFIAKYDTSGNEVWTRQFGTSAWDSAVAIAADGSGNIYVSGDTRGVFPGQISYGYSDAFVAKYDTLGNEVWTRQFDFNNNDKVSAMVADGSEYIYMVGTTGDTLPGETSSGNSDAFIMKLRD